MNNKAKIATMYFAIVAPIFNLVSRSAHLLKDVHKMAGTFKEVLSPSDVCIYVLFTVCAVVQFK